MKSKILIGTAVLSAGAIAWAAKDPVVMTVNGVDVPKSEFEYLYHKNSQQQIEAQPLEEYVGMFELYKMKVADAKAEGIDTTSEFLSEMAQYRRDLANPYLADSLYLNNLVDEAYIMSLEDVDVCHIMLPKGRSYAENKANRERIDSIRTALLEGADFETLARSYSTDGSVAYNGGHLGYASTGRIPYNFAHTAFQLKPGEISEVVESSSGYHVIKGMGKRPSRGQVKASHILKLVKPGSTPEAEAAAKAEIDSIYAVLRQNPEQFENIAMTLSDDVGSGRMGGNLGWFVAGQMIPEFSDAAFDLAIGEISAPVRSYVGWHIIKKTDARSPRSKAELKPEFLTLFDDPRDDRYKMVRRDRDSRLEKKHKGRVNRDVVEGMRNYVAANGIDSAFYVEFASPAEIFVIDGKPVTAQVFVNSLNNVVREDPYIAGLILDEKVESEYDKALIDAEEDWLYANNEDYRNLLNEYRDGSLLYEVSRRKVWDKASQDTEGLERYFRAHRDEYKFKEPRAKGILVQAKNDSVAELIKARYAELDKPTAWQVLTSEFRGQALVDRFLAHEGINRFVDYEFFGGAEPEVTPKFPVFFILDGHMIAAPEEAADVKGLVTSDYQQELEQNWTTELRKKYPVKRNDKELKKIK